MKHTKFGLGSSLRFLERRTGSRTTRQDRRNPSGVSFAPLEPRILYSGTVDLNAQPDTDAPVIMDFADTQIAPTPQPGPIAGPAVPVAGALPTLHSNPGASVKIILDFDGSAARQWGTYSVPATPAYDQDGDPSTFSTAELASVDEIFKRVAEKYSPFNVDVTTEDPGTYNDNQSIKVVIGGAGAWVGAVTAGVSFVGSFYNSLDNVCYVFPTNLSNGYAKYTAEAVAHEAGHTFGLQHQSVYNGTTLAQEYNTGDSLTAPVMGNSYSAARGLWWSGYPSNSSSAIQSDLDILSNNNNLFGFRADDYGNSIQNSTQLSLAGNTFTVAGVVERSTDADYFGVTLASSGTLTLNLNVAQYGAMLDGSLFVYNSSGAIIGSADTSSLGESLTLSLTAGNYYISVTSHGGYGDIGQYGLAGSFVASGGAGAPIADPSGLTAIALSASEIDLTWSDNSDNEARFVIQRSTDAGATWASVGRADANATSYRDTTVTGGTTYHYRIKAFNVDSASNFVPATQPATTVPSSSFVSVSAATTNSLTLTWSNVAGESGYLVKRSLNGSGWTLIATLGSNATTYIDAGLQPGTRYDYLIQSYNSTGYSVESPVANAITSPAAVGAPTVAAVSASQVTVTWSPTVGATSYRIERSLDNSAWSTLTTTALTSVSDMTTFGGTQFYYRVRATNASGESSPSTAASCLTLPDAPVGLGVVPTSATQVTVAWIPVTGASSYQIERSNDGLTGWILSGVIPSSNTSFVDSGLNGDTPYVYRVRAINASGASNYTSTATAKTLQSAPTLPTAPSSLKITTATAGAVLVTWKDNSDNEAGFSIEYSADKKTWKPAGSVPAGITSAQVAGLTPGQTYSFRVASYNEMGFSKFSLVASGKAGRTTTVSAHRAVASAAAPIVLDVRKVKPTLAGLSKTLSPEAASDLIAVSYSTSAVQLTWSDNADSELGYRVEYSRNGKTWLLGGYAAANQTGCRVTGLQKGGSYFFRVTAYNLAGVSGQVKTAKVVVPTRPPVGSNAKPSLDPHQVSTLNILNVKTTMPGLPLNVRVA